MYQTYRFYLVFTYREIMQIVLQYNHRRRPIISLPFQVGMLQGAVLEKLPVNLFTVTRSQVCDEAMLLILFSVECCCVIRSNN